MRRGVSRLSVKLFSLTESRNSVEEPFCVLQSIWYRNIFWIGERGGEGGSITTFCQIFCLTMPKNFVEKQICVSKNWWYRKMLAMKEGVGITIFR